VYLFISRVKLHNIQFFKTELHLRNGYNVKVTGDIAYFEQSAPLDISNMI